MTHLPHCLAALSLAALTGCAGLASQNFGDTVSSTTYVLNVGSAAPSTPSLRCPPYALPLQPLVPAVPLEAYRAIKPGDTKQYNALMFGYIEELRRYISEARKRNTDSVLAHALQCDLE